MSWPWNELGLEGPADLETVRRAYAQRLKTTHPEEDPEGFQKLHKAYQAARRSARRTSSRPPAPTFSSVSNPHSPVRSEGNRSWTKAYNPNPRSVRPSPALKIPSPQASGHIPDWTVGPKQTKQGSLPVPQNSGRIGKDLSPREKNHGTLHAFSQRRRANLPRNFLQTQRSPLPKPRGPTRQIPKTFVPNEKSFLIFLLRYAPILFLWHACGQLRKLFLCLHCGEKLWKSIVEFPIVPLALRRPAKTFFFSAFGSHQKKN